MDKQTTVITTWIPQVLLTRNDLAKVLQLSARTIGRLIVAGQLPAPIRVGKSYRWRPEEIKILICGPDQVGSEPAAK